MDYTYITSAKDLKNYCKKIKKSPYICLDTEFARETTYYPKLCLIQCQDENNNLAIIDPIVENLDLSPLKKILIDPKITKVFHACRQDLEIFYNLFGKVPTPVFDTQVSAMVCGYGDYAGYETLVRTMLKKRLDKSSRFSDWAQRPLNTKQIKYALSDVTHLKKIYERLSVNAKHRIPWIEEEMKFLTDERNYKVDVKAVWQKIKIQQPAPTRFMYVIQKMAEWREKKAIKEDVPRQFIIRDDVIAKLATMDLKQLSHLDQINVNYKVKSDFLKFAKKTLKESYKDGIKVEHLPVPKPLKFSKDCLEILRLLLKVKSKEHKVAERLIATTDALKQLCAGKQDIQVLQGWRKEVFGNDALKVLKGEAGLQLKNRTVKVVEVKN